MSTRKTGKILFMLALLGALLLPVRGAAQVEEARVRIDGMV
jgi:hypothetical protein